MSRVPRSTLAASFDARDPVLMAGFWAELLGREVLVEPAGRRLPGPGHELDLLFSAAPAPDAPPRMHLHLTSDDTAHQQRTVARVVELGGRPLDVGQRPDEGHVVLADPEGNALCVIEPDNRFLAGCGRLGEVACDGSSAVGRFWSLAMGWPLVWDQDGETAIQSPDGGTKVAWGGPASVPTQGRAGHRLRLSTRPSDLALEVDRLVAHGATSLGSRDGGSVELLDPDGCVFHVG